MVDWWSETEHDIVECLRRDGALSPAELGRRVGVSETEAAMFLYTLAREGKVRIRLVESTDEPQSRPTNSALASSLEPRRCR